MTGSLIGPPRVWGEAGTYTYEPTPGTARIYFELFSPGGPGGSVPACGPNKAAAAGGGAGGGWAAGWCDDPAIFTGASINLGEPPEPAPANQPRPPRSPGSLFLDVVVTGGEAGYHGVACAVPAVTDSAGAGFLQQGTVLSAANGGGGRAGMVLSPTAALSGDGGDNTWGGIARGVSGSKPGVGGEYYGWGRGGSGAVTTQNQPARTGGPGCDGGLIIWEFD